VLIPRPKTARPATGYVHPPDDDVLAADMADEFDGTIDERPPEVRGLALAEQIDAGFDPDLRAGLSQLGELLVRQTVEEAEHPKIIDSHRSVVVTFRAASSPARRRSEEEQSRRTEHSYETPDRCHLRKPSTARSTCASRSAARPCSSAPDVDPHRRSAWNIA
jgi:hypothetical protein